MPSSRQPRTNLLFILNTLIVTTWYMAEAREPTQQKPPRNHSLSALFVFGDSTVDSGNNNYIDTTTRSNFPPYGKDFPHHAATGRFTNGRLVTDFVASYLGIKDFIPPYLDPTLTLPEMISGVCFASADSGFDPLTAKIHSVISLQQQVEYFREYKARLGLSIGIRRTENIIRNAVFMVSIGTNDLFRNYYGLVPIRRKQYTISAYLDFIMLHAVQFLQDLVELGARRIVFTSLSPVGCLPAIITVHSISDPIGGWRRRECVESLSSLAQEYNRILEGNLTATVVDMGRKGRPKLYFLDIYTPLNDMIQNPSKYGFEQVHVGCCGSGLIEFGKSCNEECAVCPDDAKYVFFDAMHPTQAAYYAIFQSAQPLISQVIHDT